eukprot:NODE_27955_length_494_cov_3.564033.p3 GENE.NODE_27955_length_494_cov_3.564033~~NODE_27955_length_494_cov_3.564033.p3  ORF type:complete len:68 (-),score=4.79 NODE_27955_length_494_cov_3.564033:88-291(-)
MSLAGNDDRRRIADAAIASNSGSTATCSMAKAHTVHKISSFENAVTGDCTPDDCDNVPPHALTASHR